MDKSKEGVDFIGGRDFQVALEDALNQSAVVLVLLTNAPSGFKGDPRSEWTSVETMLQYARTGKTDWCLKEIKLALEQNKSVIPIVHVEDGEAWKTKQLTLLNHTDLAPVGSSLASKNIFCLHRDNTYFKLDMKNLYARFKDDLEIVGSSQQQQPLNRLTKAAVATRQGSADSFSSSTLGDSFSSMDSSTCSSSSTSLSSSTAATIDYCCWQPGTLTAGTGIEIEVEKDASMSTAGHDSNTAMKRKIELFVEDCKYIFTSVYSKFNILYITHTEWNIHVLYGSSFSKPLTLYSPLFTFLLHLHFALILHRFFS